MYKCLVIQCLTLYIYNTTKPLAGFYNYTKYDCSWYLF